MNKSFTIHENRYHTAVRFAVVAVFIAAAVLFARPASAAATGSLIYIEPGHGMNSGAYSYPGGYYEDTVNLEIAIRLNNLLTNNGYPTYMARTDNSVNLSGSQEDADMDQANAMGAAIFLSIHNNASTSPSAGGTETHYSPKSPADISFANLVQTNMVNAIRAYGHNTNDRGLIPHYMNEAGGPWMICRGNMPSVLVETLFVSNPTEAAILRDGNYQQAVAQALYNAITAMVPPPTTINQPTGFSYLYDYDNATSRMWTMNTDNAVSPRMAPVLGWTSAAGGFDAKSTRLTTGDFDGNGTQDVAALYDYGGSTAGLWYFLRNANGVFTPSLVWKSAAGAFNPNRAKMVSGNFDGEGADDIAFLYDYGNATAALWTLYRNGTMTTTNMVWSSAPGAFDASRAKVAAGEFSGDAKADIAVLYDYGGATSRLWTFVGSAYTMEPVLSWSSASGAFDANRAKLAAGDFKGDGKADIAALYDYGNATSRIWTFSGSAQAMQPSLAWASFPGAFDANRAKMVAGGFGHDSKADLAILYDYNGSSAGVWTFISNSGLFYPNLAWRSAGFFAASKTKTKADTNDGYAPVAEPRPTINPPINGGRVGSTVPLSWNSVSGATSYEVEILNAPPEMRETDGSTASVNRVSVVAATVNRVALNTANLASGRTFYYRVVAKKGTAALTKFSLPDHFETNPGISAGKSFPVLYDYGGSTSAVWTMLAVAGDTPSISPSLAWYSGSGGLDVPRSQITAGDFDANGTMDAAVLYDTGNKSAELRLLFDRQETGALTAQTVWRSSGEFNASKTRITTGDFTGDGKSDVALIYDYDNAQTRLWIFEWNGQLAENSAEPYLAWDSGAGGLDAVRIKMISAGNFAGSGLSDVVFLYDAGNDTTELRGIITTGYKAVSTSAVLWRSAAGAFSAGRAKMTSGDYDGAGFDDVAVLYDYGSATSRFWVFTSNGTALSPFMAWVSAPGGFDAARARLASGDFGGDAKKDIAAFYDYGLSNSGIWSFISSGSSLAPYLAWRSGSGMFDAGRAKMEGEPSRAVTYTPLSFTGNGPFEARDANNNLLASYATGQTAVVGYSAGTYYVTTASGGVLATPSFIRITPVGTTILQALSVPSFTRYRGVLEVRYSPISNKVWIVNELDMNSYLKGMGEEPETWPGGAGEPVSTAERYQEFLKLSAVAFRSYAYDVTVKKNKHPGEPFDLCNSPASCQWYIGYERETYGGNLAAAVSSTSGQVATYQGTVARIPYFSDCDGRTRSAQEVWGSTSYPWCVGVSDADVCSGHVLRGHGVGICMNGARWRAASGWTYSPILHYYLTIDAALGTIGNPSVRLGLHSITP